MDDTRDMVRVYNTTKSSCLGEQIEVADSSLRRMVGLLGKRSLAQGCGLLIVPSQAIHTVGMAFPIDVIFVDKKYNVVGVREADTTVSHDPRLLEGARGSGTSGWNHTGFPHRGW